MSSRETKKSAAKFGKFGSKKSSAPFKIPKLVKPTEPESAGERTEELPEEELLDESDLEELDDSELEDDNKLEPPASGGRVASGTLEVRDAPVDPYGATQSIGIDDVRTLRAHKAVHDAARRELSGELPGISGDPLAAAAAPFDHEAAAVAALDGLEPDSTVEEFAPSPSPQPSMMSPPPGALAPPMMSPPPGALAPPPTAAQSGPFPAVHTPYPGYATGPQQPIPTPYPPPQAPPAGSMEAARQASWKQAHPSARRWARRRDNAAGGRPTPAPLRIGAGLILIGIGVYLLAIFIPAHKPDAPKESERTEAGTVWRFSETQHSLAAALAFGFVALGLFGTVRGAVYRREVTARCRTCKMKVEATRAGLVLKCHNGGHTAGIAVSSVAMLAAFLCIGLATVILLLSASLG